MVASQTAVIIDCDPGVDDAIALLLALASPELQVLGVTTVAGNVSLQQTQTNARRICELAARSDIPVYAGCPRPLMRPLETAEMVHGATGLGNISLPNPKMPLRVQHGVDFLIDTLLQAPQPLTLATLGPLTNVAVAIVKEPRIVPKIRELVLMGGAITQGNVTPSAEFNLYTDPHAAQIVFTAGMPLTMVSLDVTHRAIATPARIDGIRSINTPIGELVATLLTQYDSHSREKYRFSGPPLHDPCVIAYLIHPKLFQARTCFVEVETMSDKTLGRTIVDWWGVSGKTAQVKVLTNIDSDGFYRTLTERLARLVST
ncbi:MAG: nucleoside hydrolase [Synechococcales bacterium]|nr:nucleoside hydrolase [Synechococcales bacterium]